MPSLEISRAAHAAPLPLAHLGRTASGYLCLLDEQPSFLVPARLLPRARPRVPARLVVNPLVWFSWTGSPPHEIAPWTRVFSGPPPDGGMAWISDPSAGSLLPFWLGPEARAALARSQPGAPAPSGLAPHLRDALLESRVLISPAREKRRLARCSAALDSASLAFRRGFVPLSGLIHPFHVGALRRYFRWLIRSGALRLGDAQSRLRYVAHNEPVARFFHHQLAAVMSRVAARPLKPSYVYFASYQGGAELERHTDRPQCEFSLTYCLDFTPEPASATAWPIRLDTPHGSVTVYQAIGDALAYRGCRLPHYRNRLWRGATSSSIFFHFVPEDFSGSLR
ncbi:MAG TPA: hypothetical protein VLW54_11455 [Candidatus Acidoferrales bacterium]|nr:hypothetical protein [Candidatus Acidoferrales bacterium]